MTASHAADAATDSDATSEAAPVTDTAAAIAAAKDTAGGNGHTRRRRRFPWPSTFRGRLIATISIAALAMLATVIITQNIIVSQAARQQKNNIVMCTDKDTGELITVYFDKNQTSYDLDLEDAPDASQLRHRRLLPDALGTGGYRRDLRPGVHRHQDRGDAYRQDGERHDRLLHHDDAVHLHRHVHHFRRALAHRVLARRLSPVQTRGQDQQAGGGVEARRSRRSHRPRRQR